MGQLPTLMENSPSVPNSKSVLIFTFIGYSKQEIVVGNQAKINVQLKEDAQNLDEVVVVGYGTAKKSDLTGATASLRPDANDASKAVSIDGLLQGKDCRFKCNSLNVYSGGCFFCYYSWC